GDTARPAAGVSPDAASTVAPATPDRQGAQPAACPMTGSAERDPYAPSPDSDPVSQAQDLVREIYERQLQSESGSVPSALHPSTACNYFTDDIVRWLASGKIDAHPLYGAQDFDGVLGDPAPDQNQ